MTERVGIAGMSASSGLAELAGIVVVAAQWLKQLLV